MCGRYGRFSDKQKIAECFYAKKLPSRYAFAANYNVCPNTKQPVVRLDPETGEREITVMRWGFIPSFSTDDKCGFTIARGESVATKNSFRDAFKKRHCIVPADLFYEWQRLDSKRKNTHAWAIARKDREMFGMGAIWETWTDEATGQPLDTFAIITTDPNHVMQPIEERMPVILPRTDYDRWLEPIDPARPPIDLLRPYPAEQLEAWRVAKTIGNVYSVGPQLCTPWDEVPVEQTASLFGDNNL